jgi:hypothetical protein
MWNFSRKITTKVSIIQMVLTAKYGRRILIRFNSLTIWSRWRACERGNESSVSLKKGCYFFIGWLTVNVSMSFLHISRMNFTHLEKFVNIFGAYVSLNAPWNFFWIWGSKSGYPGRDLSWFLLLNSAHPDDKTAYGQNIGAGGKGQMPPQSRIVRNYVRTRDNYWQIF